MTSRTAGPRLPAAIAGTLLLALLGLTTLTGCSSNGSDDSGDPGDTADSAPAASADGPAREGGGRSSDTLSVAGSLDSGTPPENAHGTRADDSTAPALIRRGTISLTATDVDAARLDARKVVDEHNGTIDAEETSTDDDGDASTVRMVIRVPAADFDEVVDQLDQVATLSDSSTSSTDVRDRVIHTHVQIGVQRDAIARIRQLLSRATNIGDIIRIEGELTDRIARLETLQRTAAYLADQTSMSTITLYIEKAKDRSAPPEEKHRTGFIGGLDSGWGAFTDAAVWLSAAVGAVLPFAVTLAIIGVPLGWVLRRRLRRIGVTSAVTPDAG
jgi:hypothetical protein